MPVPAQAYEGEAALEEAVKVLVALVQLITGGLMALIVGLLPLLVTVAAVVVEQPLVPSVTVTVNCPAAFTVTEALVVPEVMPVPAQAYDGEAALEEAVKVLVALLQLMTGGVMLLRVGWVLSKVTFTVVEVAHPPALVMVTV